MKTLFVLILFGFGVARGFVIGYDDAACVSGGATPITRVIDASIPVRINTPNFNFSDSSSEYPQDTLCQWQLNLGNPSLTELQLSFRNFSLEFATDCRNDYLEVRDVDASGTVLAKLCGLNIIPADITTFNRGLHLTFKSNSNGVEGSGFLARVGFPYVVTACDGDGAQTFDNENGGVFSTLDYPSPYGDFWICEYQFVAPAGQRVRVSFNDFETEEECNKDYMIAYNGPSTASQSLGWWYGAEIPAMITSGNDSLFLRLSTNGDTGRSGFFGTYEMI